MKKNNFDINRVLNLLKFPKEEKPAIKTTIYDMFNIRPVNINDDARKEGDSNE